MVEQKSSRVVAWRAMARGGVYIGSGPVYGRGGVGGQGGLAIGALVVEQLTTLPLGQAEGEMVSGGDTSMLESSPSATHIGRSKESDASWGLGR